MNYVIVAVVLLGIGYVIKKAELWSYYSNMTVPYFCSAIAVSLMVVASTALICQKPASEIPGMAIAIICVVLIILMGILIFVNVWSNRGSQLFVTSISEWLGTSVILVLAFILPRFRHQ